MAAMVNLCISVPINNDPGGICRMNINRVMPQINARMQARFMFIIANENTGYIFGID